MTSATKALKKLLRDFIEGGKKPTRCYVGNHWTTKAGLFCVSVVCRPEYHPNCDIPEAWEVGANMIPPADTSACLVAWDWVQDIHGYEGVSVEVKRHKSCDPYREVTMRFKV